MEDTDTFQNICIVVYSLIKVSQCCFIDTYSRTNAEMHGQFRVLQTTVHIPACCMRTVLIIIKICTILSIIYYIKLLCPFFCPSSCTSHPPPPPLRPDRRTATKFGTHIRIDTGLWLSPKTNVSTLPQGDSRNRNGCHDASPSRPLTLRDIT